MCKEWSTCKFPEYIRHDFFSRTQAFPSSHLIPAADVPDVDHQVDLRGPLLKLSLPGGHGGERYHHEERTVEPVLVVEAVQEANGLDGLAQPHLVRQYHRVVSRWMEGTPIN